VGQIGAIVQKGSGEEMTEYLEAHKPSGIELVTLGASRVTVGKDASNDVVITHDATVSRLHAVFEPYGSGWALRDLGSRNGSYVNGERILSERALHPGDEIRLGNTRLVFRGEERTATETHAAEPPPSLTRRERHVLLALCRPLVSPEPFSQPASIRQIAAELVVSDAAVKQHLGHLFDKFGIYEGVENRRVRLANEALHRGVVTAAELQALKRREPSPRD
jgi:hypothetical protein